MYVIYIHLIGILTVSERIISYNCTSICSHEYDIMKFLEKAQFMNRNYVILGEKQSLPGK